MANLIKVDNNQCIYSPGVECYDMGRRVEGRPGISKLMSRKTADGEQRHANVLKEIDPDMKYHVGDPYICSNFKNSPTASTDDKEMLSQCPYELDNPVTLNYKPSGIPMSDMIAKRVELGISRKSLFRAFLNILTGVGVFTSHTLNYNNIKLDNIMYSKTDKTMKLTNFNLAVYYDIFIKFYGSPIPSTTFEYVHYPPETAGIYGVELTPSILSKRTMMMRLIITRYFGHSRRCKLCQQLDEITISDIPIISKSDIPDALKYFDVYSLGICLYIMARKFLRGDGRTEMIKVALMMTAPDYTKRPNIYLATNIYERMIDTLYPIRGSDMPPGEIKPIVELEPITQVKMIGEGAYGCAFMPSITCEEVECGSECQNGISKLMSRKHAIDEIRELERVDVIDPEMKYHVGGPHMCSKLGTGFAKATKDCGKTIYDPVTLNYPYGGMDLEKIANSFDDTMIPMSDLFRAFGNLIEGIAYFTENQYVHHDVKLPNIVYDATIKSMRFIDFGLSSSYDTLIEEFHDNYDPEPTSDAFLAYAVFPPEVVRVYNQLPTPELLILRSNNTNAWFNAEEIAGRCYICEQVSKTTMDDLPEFYFHHEIIRALEKFDIYGLGLSLYTLATKLLTDTENNRLRRSLIRLSLRMTRSKSESRISPKEALVKYTALMDRSFPV